MRARLLAISLLAIAGLGATGCPAPTAPKASATPAELPSAAPSPSPRLSPSPTPKPSPSRDPNVQRRFTFKGTSDLAMVGPFRLVAGDRLFRCTFDGRGTISVFLIRHDGQKDAQLFNHQGAFSEAVPYTVAASDDFYLQIAGADGPWMLEIE